MGLLADVFSYGDGLKRRLGGLLSDPVGTIELGARRFNDDQDALQRQAQDAGFLPGSRSVLQRPQDRQQARAQFADKALEAYGGLLGATVWHGSPHKFSKFDSSKIGTGEGKQQQGVGSYLADAQTVAQKYADKESWKRGMESGYLYKVDMPDSMISSMANHDAPLRDQPKSVKDAILKMIDADAMKALKGYHGWEKLDDAPFAAILDSMEIANGNNRAATSQILRQQGIPGIRYLDGGSRGAGTGTSNYVIFPGNEGLLKILERNGQALP